MDDQPSYGFQTFDFANISHAYEPEPVENPERAVVLYTPNVSQMTPEYSYQDSMASNSHKRQKLDTEDGEFLFTFQAQDQNHQIAGQESFALPHESFPSQGPSSATSSQFNSQVRQLYNYFSADETLNAGNAPVESAPFVGNGVSTTENHSFDEQNGIFGGNIGDVINDIDFIINDSSANLTEEERTPIGIIKQNKIKLTPEILSSEIFGKWKSYNENDRSRSSMLHWLVIKSVEEKGIENINRFTQLATHMLEMGADPKHCDLDDDNVLMTAALFGSLSVYNAILSFEAHGHDADLWNKQNKSGNLPLHLAIGSTVFSAAPFIQLFASKTRDINSVKKDGNSSLHLLFLGNDYKKSVEYGGISHKKHRVNPTSGTTIYQLVKILLKAGASKTIKNKKGSYPIECAIAANASENLLMKLYDESFESAAVKRITQDAMRLPNIPMQLLIKLSQKSADYGYYVDYDIRNKHLREQIMNAQKIPKLPLFPTLKQKIKDRKLNEVLTMLQEMNDKQMIKQVLKNMPYLLTRISSLSQSKKLIHQFTVLLVKKFHMDVNRIDPMSGFVLHNMIVNFGGDRTTSRSALAFLLRETNVDFDTVHTIPIHGEITPLQFALDLGQWEAAVMLICKGADTIRVKINNLRETEFTVCFQLLREFNVNLKEDELVEDSYKDDEFIMDELKDYRKYCRDDRKTKKNKEISLLSRLAVDQIIKQYKLEIPKAQKPTATVIAEEIDLESD